MFHYISLKHTLMSGGVNHIMTGFHHRQQVGQLNAGQVLRTLIEKYGYQREQFFISSEMGYTAFDGISKTPRDIEVEEIVTKGTDGIKHSDFMKEIDMDASTIDM